jgi:hypothetical protein
MPIILSLDSILTYGFFAVLLTPTVVMLSLLVVPLWWCAQFIGLVLHRALGAVFAGLSSAAGVTFEAFREEFAAHSGCEPAHFRCLERPVARAPFSYCYASQRSDGTTLRGGPNGASKYRPRRRS